MGRVFRQVNWKGGVSVVPTALGAEGWKKGEEEKNGWGEIVKKINWSSSGRLV